MLPEGLDQASVNKLLDVAIAEDIGSGDITSKAVIPQGTQFGGTISAREEIVCAGLPLVELVFGKFSQKINCELAAEDGMKVSAGTANALTRQSII